MVLSQSAILLHKQKFRVKVKFLPPFQPNEYLYETHAERGGGERWKVMAWAVRDAMLKNSELEEEPNNYGHEERVKLVEYLNGKAKTWELDENTRAEAERVRTQKQN